MLTAVDARSSQVHMNTKARVHSFRKEEGGRWRIEHLYSPQQKECRDELWSPFSSSSSSSAHVLSSTRVSFSFEWRRCICKLQPEVYAQLDFFSQVEPKQTSVIFFSCPMTLESDRDRARDTESEREKKRRIASSRTQSEFGEP